MNALFKNDTATGIKAAAVLVGTHTVTSAQASANTSIIDLSDAMKVVEGGVVQIVDSGNNVVTSDADITFGGTAGTLTVADGSTYNTTAGYLIRYVVWGSQAN